MIFRCFCLMRCHPWHPPESDRRGDDATAFARMLRTPRLRGLILGLIPHLLEQGSYGVSKP